SHMSVVLKKKLHIFLIFVNTSAHLFEVPGNKKTYRGRLNRYYRTLSRFAIFVNRDGSLFGTPCKNDKTCSLVVAHFRYKNSAPWSTLLAVKHNLPEAKFGN